MFDSVVLESQQRKAPMNSGWTKLAAIASTTLTPRFHLTIWDSRVAHSLIRRMDAWFASCSLQALPAAVAEIGRVPGRGGTRASTQYQLAWPSGYRKWSAQFAGSELVREIRDELNARQWKLRDRARWTVRDVEMVLFMDGY